MTTQYIIVGLIITLAAGNMVYRLIRSIVKPSSKCDGCSSNCGRCALQEFRKTG
ncbi:MAG: FeoB-associated Cys-rich membrane protein [Bacteroidota bacterium]